MTPENVPVLKLSKISRSFGNVKAVNAVSLEIKKGEVVGLVGENGAGKSTLLKILAGMVQPDEGEIEINGAKASFRGPSDAFKAGVGVVHQEQSLFLNLTVAENIEQRSSPRVGLSRLGLQDWSRVNREAAEVLDKIGVKLSPKARVGDLSFLDRQMVEIARAVCIDPNTTGTPLIILDEPTSVLEQAETAVLEREIRNLRTLGCVIFVSHRLDEILRICDRVVVMRSGRLVSDQSTQGLTKEALFNAMVDEASHTVPQPRTRPSRQAKAAIEVRDLTRRGAFRNMSLSVYPGQIVALVGANGSGCGELMRAIFGAETFESGSIEVNGRRVARWSVRRAVSAGLAYVPAERKVEGMIGGFSAARNIALTHPGEAAAGPFLKPRGLASIAQSWFSRLDVKPNDIRRPLAQFSGGNQQKVVLAKWLNSSNLKVLMLDHPLRGLDVGASQIVNSQVRRASETGTAVLLIPDTIEEAIEMADEILVMRDGELSARHDLTSNSDLALHDIVAEMV